MEETIFTKIIYGDIPSHKVYEDDKVFAFLDIHPVQPGHVLVVPKKPIEFLWDLPDEDYLALMAAVKKIGRRLRDVLGVPYVGVKVIGVDVPHAHVHLIPFTTTEQFNHVADQSITADNSELAALAVRLAF